ncbi:hypothetical protein OnM2_077053 [Erysiphe neolycopersici]|uniref:Retrovirus-related Pol polyprotein from transposon TNT 1-94-like beta-barrel domain-containing protein n=1 Tax=Erysiphe neolycopersici TaxID=212602 RepID=A0A420HHS7_9PEZI|nr:hypothetical protein OnM2_077053 [Erysiphe neolycopersici]
MLGIFLIIAYLEQKNNKSTEKIESLNNANFASTFDEFRPEIISSNVTRDKVFFVPTIVTSGWILDSGCSAHMTSRIDLLHSLDTHQGFVTMANGDDIVVKGVGSV